MRSRGRLAEHTEHAQNSAWLRGTKCCFASSSTAPCSVVQHSVPSSPVTIREERLCQEKQNPTFLHFPGFLSFGPTDVYGWFLLNDYQTR